MTTKKEKVDWRVVLGGIICLTAIEIVALLNGVNGVLMATILTIIGLAIGVAIPISIIKK